MLGRSLAARQAGNPAAHGVRDRRRYAVGGGRGDVWCCVLTCADMGTYQVRTILLSNEPSRGGLRGRPVEPSVGGAVRSPVLGGSEGQQK